MGYLVTLRDGDGVLDVELSDASELEDELEPPEHLHAVLLASLAKRPIVR